METTNVIQATQNYDQFKILKSNREVDRNHVRRLSKSMREHPHLFATRPILVNENMFVIDGQHRLAAAKETGIPVYYMVSNGISVDDTRTLNTTQSNWTMLDFAKSYADTGNEHYKTFLAAVAKYPGLPMAAIRAYLRGSANGSSELQSFKTGDFVVPQPQVSDVFLEQLYTIKKKANQPVSRGMSVALLSLFNKPDVFDYDYFVTKLDGDGARDFSLRHSEVKTALRDIEDLYNFGRFEKNRVRFY